MTMVEPLKFRTMLREGKNGKAVDIGNILTDYHPSMAGWMSERFCIYPQTLILQFEKPVIITKLQILTHRIMIPEKITLSLGDCGNQLVSLKRAVFSDPIGDVIFNDPNDKSSLDARELKNVEILSESDQFVNFLSMDVYKNYPSKKNKYNQVCLIALSVLGRTMDTIGINDAASNFLCDLASLVYVDPEITENIQKLRELKNAAAALERFTFADKARQAIACLREIGYEHGKLLVESDKAQKSGDLERARELKTQAESIKLQTVLDIHMNDLLLNGELFKESAPKN